MEKEDAVNQIHEVDTTLTQDVLYPAHAPRGPGSAEFEQNKRQLIDGDKHGCWICGATEKLEAHHIFEWSLFDDLDPKLMQNVLEILDFYGYSAKMTNPLLTPDDIRNLLILCELHHRGSDNGVHAITFPIWVAFKALKPGVSITKQVQVAQTAEKLKLIHLSSN